MADKTNVLFLCTGNSARSQMAESFLRAAASDRFEAYSAGLDPSGISTYTRQVMAEIGHDLAGQWSKSVREYMGKKHFGYLITVCDQAEERCPSTFPAVSARLHWSFEDPAAFVGTDDEKAAKFREVRDLIRSRVAEWVTQVT